MNWLARMRVPYEVAAVNRLRDGYDWHKALWRAFPGRDGESRNFLTRIDKREREIITYLLSESKPDCPNWCPQKYWELAEIKDSFLTHEYYHFDLLVNPTRSVTKIGSDGQPTKNGRREALLRTEEQVLWLQRKAKQGGFQVLDLPPLEISKPHRLTFRHEQGGGTHFGIQFRGALQMVDQAAFRQTFRLGIGSAKGFGFGMLMLQPIAL